METSIPPQCGRICGTERLAIDIEVKTSVWGAANMSRRPDMITAQITYVRERGSRNRLTLLHALLPGFKRHFGVFAPGLKRWNYFAEQLSTADARKIRVRVNELRREASVTG
jgi:hypothetical protein